MANRNWNSRTGPSAARTRPLTKHVAGRAGQAPALDRLESRIALSATLLDNGTLLVIGSPQDDAIVIHERDQNGAVALSGVAGVPDGSVFENVRFVRVLALPGHDHVSVSGTPRDAGGDRMRFKLLGGNGADTLRGGNAADDIRGGNGADTIAGKNGSDFLRGGKGADLIIAQRGNDTARGDVGPDTILGGPGADTLRGNNGDDALRGGNGVDALEGGFGEDDLFGGDGADILAGDGDRDLLRGPINEFQDFSPEDAFHSEVIGRANENFAVLSDTFWLRVDDQVGQGDIADNARTAIDSLQLLRARSADERAEFEQEWAELTEARREEARESIGGIIDDFLADIEDNPGDLTAARLAEFQLNVRDEFPDEVRDEFDDYVGAMTELDDDLSALGDAIDDLEDDGLAAPFLAQWAEFWVF